MSARRLLLALSLTACGTSATGRPPVLDAATADGALDGGVSADAQPLADTPGAALDRAPTPDLTAPGDAPPTSDAPPPVDAGLSCASPGAPRTPTPPTTPSATSDFNVTLLACTRTALALSCELGVSHRYEEVIDGNLRRLRANGVPNHDVGAFPNPGNPNTISAQTYEYAVPLTPSGPGANAQVFGITTAGVVLDPGTAERWNDSMSWSYEALRYASAPGYFSGSGATDRVRHPTALGLDCNFAHVQPDGAYHYHGIPSGLMPEQPALTFVGWAADGYPIFGRWDRSNPNDPSSALREMRSSYRLRAGTRPSGSAGPGGSYDGTFVQDWEYSAGAGDLDECNGRAGMVPLQGREVSTYHYVLTNTFPYIPRCFHATPHSSFQRMMMPPQTDAGVPSTDAGTTGPRACSMPSDCNGACPPGSRGCACANTPMGMRCVPTCSVTSDCPMAPPGMTFTCRNGACAP